MTVYILKRLVSALLVVIGVSIVTFGLLHFIGPTPGRAALGMQASLQAVNAWDKSHGYDRSVFVQYISYINAVIHGNLGYSYKQDQPVLELFQENAARTAYLSGASMVLAILIAIPLGIYQAVKRNSIGDYVATATSFTLYSMPIFFLGLLLIQAFALGLHLFPSEAAPQTGILTVVENIHAMVLPIVTLAAVQVASYSRYQRTSALDVLAQDYIRLARAKGLSERLVVTRHLVRNSVLPIITLIGMSIPYLLAGNIIVETLFNYSGLGFLFYTALQNEDYNTLLALTLIGAVLVVIGNLIADVAISIADPRVRL